MPDYLFVYGTLRRGADHPMYRLLHRHADFVGAASCAGRLYNLGWYPGLVPDAEAGARVVGEVYRLHPGAFAELLRQLDWYEGCDGAVDDEYRREQHPVRLSDGRTVPAWTYCYNRPTDGLAAIPSGDFLQERPPPSDGHQG